MSRTALCFADENSEDMAAKQMTLDDSAALLRVNSKAVTKGTMEGIVYGTGTYVLMTLFKTQKRYRAPMSGFIGLLHFVTAAGKAKRPEVLVAEFLPCETPLGDYVRGEVERRLPEDDPLARLHRQVSDLVRQNPSMSRIEARARGWPSVLFYHAARAILARSSCYSITSLSHVLSLSLSVLGEFVLCLCLGFLRGLCACVCVTVPVLLCDCACVFLCFCFRLRAFTFAVCGTDSGSDDRENA